MRENQHNSYPNSDDTELDNEVENIYSKITEMSLTLSQIKDHQRNSEGEQILYKIRNALHSQIQSLIHHHCLK